MRVIPSELQAHLDTGATTLCWCWRVVRRDGTVLGFTDHDRDLSFAGTTFAAATGMNAGEMRQSVGLSVDNFEVESALTSDVLSEADLAAGVYDGAQIEIYRVNWAEPAMHLKVRSGTIGEVARSDHAFTAEIRGLADALQQRSGRLFQATCDVDLGDPKCGIDLALPAYQTTGVVDVPSGTRALRTSSLSAFSSAWFSRGLLRWTGGQNVGQAIEVKRHVRSDDADLVELWHAPSHPIVSGDQFLITAGCDKRFETCRDRFANAVNFRGFPHMPGNDFITAYPNADDGSNSGAGS